MAHIAETLGTDHRSGVASGLLGQIRVWFAQRRVYNQTYRELSQLSTRELDDLGISRSMISRLAYEAANKI